MQPHWTRWYQIQSMAVVVFCVALVACGGGSARSSSGTDLSSTSSSSSSSSSASSSGIVGSSSSSSSSSASSSSGQAVEGDQVTLLVGGFGEGLYEVAYNVDRDVFTAAIKVADVETPSFAAINTRGDRVYALSHADESKVTIYGRTSAGLTVLGEASTNGVSAAHIALSADGKHLAAANFYSGEVVYFKVADEGILLEPPQWFAHDFAEEQSYVHWVGWDNNAQYFYATDFADNSVIVYDVNANGDLAGEGRVALTLSGGVRHMAFARQPNMVYVLTEYEAEIIVARQTDGGDLQELSRTRTLPEEFDGENQAAHIQVSEDGRFVYASNRGHNSIAVLAASADGESLSLLQTIQSNGDWPRAFLLVDSLHRLFVANERSDEIAVFAVADDGRLSLIDTKIEVPQPTYLGVLPDLPTETSVIRF